MPGLLPPGEPTPDCTTETLAAVYVPDIVRLEPSDDRRVSPTDTTNSPTQHFLDLAIELHGLIKQ